MKKLNIKENGNFNVVSHTYVLYGRKYGDRCYIHLETPTCYTIAGVEWKDVILLVREKISWKEFISIIAYQYSVQEKEEYWESLPDYYSSYIY